LTGKCLVALALLVLVVAAACDVGSLTGSPTPYPTLIPLATAPPSMAPTSAKPSVVATATTSSSAPPAPLALPAEFTKVVKGRNSYSYTPASKTGVLVQGTPKNTRLGHCGLASPIDLDGAAWDPMYGDDGQGGPLTEDQLGDLHNEGKVTITLLDENTLQLVTRHGATITLVRHEGPKRYSDCA
jgi:hypothetical protein